MLIYFNKTRSQMCSRSAPASHSEPTKFSKARKLCDFSKFSKFNDYSELNEFSAFGELNAFGVRRHTQHQSRVNPLRNHRGNALFELIPLLVLVTVMFTFILGFFGVIHSTILNDIAARNYAFETFRHRSDLTYLRPTTPKNEYKTSGMRFHTINSERSDTTGGFFATSRRIDQFSPGEELKGNAPAVHATEVDGMNLNIRFSKTGVNPVWIRTGYGICVTPACGD